MLEPAVELQLVQAVCAQLPAMVFQQVIDQLITEENMVIAYTAPEREGLAHPTEAELLSVIEKVKARLSKGHEDAIAEVSALMSELQVADEARKAEIVTRIDSNTEYAIIQNQLNEEVNRRLIEDISLDIEKTASADLAQWCADSGISITLDLLREFRRAGFIL